MSKEITLITDQSLEMAGINRAQFDMLKETYCKDLEDQEIIFYGSVCRELKLNPLLKQVYPVKRFDKSQNKKVMTIQTSIDGYRSISESTGKYCPGKKPTYTYDKDGNLFSATAYVLKLCSDGIWREVEAEALYSEYVQEFNGIPTQFWKKMRHTMLAKCAETLALRKAFPNLFSVIRSDEEMSQADNTEAPSKINYRTGELQEVKEVKQLEQVKEPVITAEQAENLKVILSECSKSHRDKVWKLMSRKPFNCMDVKNMTISLYNSVYQGSVEDRVITLAKKDAELAQEVASEVSVFDDSSAPTDEAAS